MGVMVGVIVGDETATTGGVKTLLRLPWWWGLVMGGTTTTSMDDVAGAEHLFSATLTTRSVASAIEEIIPVTAAGESQVMLGVGEIVGWGVGKGCGTVGDGVGDDGTESICSGHTSSLAS